MKNTSFNSHFGLSNQIPLCSNGQIACTICIAPKCQKQALQCENNQCTCQKDHQKCLTMNLLPLLKNISQKKQNMSKYFRPIQQTLEKVFQNLIDKLSDIRQNLIKKIESSWLSDTQNILIQFLKSSNFEQITGKKVVNQVCNNLYNVFQFSKKEQITQNLQIYEAQLMKDISTWNKTIQSIIFKERNQIDKQKKQHFFDTAHSFNAFFNISEDKKTATKIKNGKEICLYSQNHLFKTSKLIDQFSIINVKSTNQWIIYGLATQQLKLNKSMRPEDILHHTDFIGYNMHQGGCVYQMGKGYLAKNIKNQQQLNTNYIRNDKFLITIKVSKIQKKVIWIKNKTIILAQAKLTKNFIQKELYPCIFLFWSGDTVQLMSQNQQIEQ